MRLSPRAQRLLPAQFGTAGTRAMERAGPTEADGWAEVLLPVERSDVAVGDILRLGTEAEVVGPPALRQAVADAVVTLAARYATPPPGETPRETPGVGGPE